MHGLANFFYLDGLKAGLNRDGLAAVLVLPFPCFFVFWGFFWLSVSCLVVNVLSGISVIFVKSKAIKLKPCRSTEFLLYSCRNGSGLLSFWSSLFLL